jgi:hypothetical protein
VPRGRKTGDESFAIEHCTAERGIPFSTDDVDGADEARLVRQSVDELRRSRLVRHRDDSAREVPHVPERRDEIGKPVFGHVHRHGNEGPEEPSFLQRGVDCTRGTGLQHGVTEEREYPRGASDWHVGTRYVARLVPRRNPHRNIRGCPRRAQLGVEEIQAIS